MAGSSTPEGMTTAELTRLVRAAGREPLERDTLYNLVQRSDDADRRSDEDRRSEDPPLRVLGVGL
jgi:2-iminoacetate synthase ThiH